MNIMTTDSRFKVKTGATVRRDEREAVKDIFEQVYQPGFDAVLFFCSSCYDLARLGTELKSMFPCLLIGCTTAGEISSKGYQKGGIVAAGFSSPELKLHSHVISPLDRFGPGEAQKIARSVSRDLVFSNRIDKTRMFGFLMIDGLSVLEEQTTAFIYNQFEGIPIVGGSAGDDLLFRETKIYSDGRFISNAAVITLFETTLPFAVFKNQHFVPTDKKLVITGADPLKRIVSEINAEPAAEEYARILGISMSDLCPEVFSKYPLMIKIADSWHVRAIQKLNEDGSLSFFGAIDTGLVLTVGDCGDLTSSLKDEFDRLSREVPNIRLILGCDCILRKVEILGKGLTEQVDTLLRPLPFIGFNTYGEQYNSIHVNQTLTGIAIGG